MIVTGFGQPELVIVRRAVTSEDPDDGHDSNYLLGLLDLTNHDALSFGTD